MLFTSKFGIGHIWVTPNGGLQAPNASGVELNTIQDFSVDFSGKGVELRGQFLYPVDARVADINAKGKFKVGEWSLEQLNTLFFGGTIATTGNDIPTADEPHTIPSSGPYTVQVTNFTGFVQPLTVAYASDLSNLDEVLSLTAPGQYTVNVSTGTFTFFGGADAGVAVVISYLSTGAGASLTIPNNLQGQSPILGIAAINSADGNGILLPNVRVTGMKPVELKMNAFAMCEVDFNVFCPPGASVGQLIQIPF